MEDTLKAQIAIYKDEYNKEQDAKTLRNGRIFTITAMLLLVYFVFQDMFIFKHPLYFQLIMLIAVVPVAVHLVAIHTILVRYVKHVRIFHSVSLASINIMLLIFCYILYSVPGYTDNERYAVIAALLVASFASYMIASSVKKLLLYILGIPYLVFFIALFISNPGFPYESLMLLSFPAAACILVSIQGRYQEKISQSEFRMRMLADKRKEELELEVEKVRSLNSELQIKIDENKILEKKLMHQAMYDAQTGMLNKNPGLENLTRDIDFSIRSGSRLTVCYTDMDNLKWINDNFGHAEGDRIIELVANCINKSIRKSDYAIRMGGDEFLIVYRNCTEASARSAMIRIKEEMVRSYKVNRLCGDDMNRESIMNFSMGFHEYDPLTKSGVNEVIHIADSRMYEEKSRKREITM